MDLVIRKLTTIEEVRLIKPLEEKVWQSDAVPLHQLYTAVQNGGLLIGAFHEERLIGFSYSFPGFQDGSVYLCSHMLGIDPDYRSQGIGRKLKERQLILAEQMGYELVVWTYDPLESRNAYLNLTKLHGICSTYLENWYGEMADGLNQGLPTDRFKVEWWIRSKRVQSAWMPDAVLFEQPCSISYTASGNPQIKEEIGQLCLGADGYEIPVPTDIQQMKKAEPALAYKWRMQLRTIFQQLFAAGYAAVGVRRTQQDKGIYYYQLVRRESLPL
ncbi:GNAT family N-acetyltransferase [Sporosarcina sp. Te-1]|uniref:GNAT family N-acetyltransferase n=1 Tax=Sporosarcina sp. Te-1 TaxID=2818390 RepID=UPI001A9F8AA5|nr:GNAT family N-acetyltransferase [Sporosarcina sp. Te-1]QTD42106.1 GNAT family N-acetyltransferase [Sporosarcina sp. Te-1]